MMAKGTGSMTKDMKSALEVLAEATESHLGKHPVSRSVSDLAAQPTDNNIKTTQHVFDRLPAEDKIRVSRIAEEAAKKRAEEAKGAPVKPQVSRQDISGLDSIDSLLEDEVGALASGKNSLT